MRGEPLLAVGGKQQSGEKDPIYDVMLGTSPTREHYVDAAAAAQFLNVERRTILQWAREARIPAHPLSEGKRKCWRFLLSELDAWMQARVNSPRGAARVITKESGVR